MLKYAIAVLLAVTLFITVHHIESVRLHRAALQYEQDRIEELRAELSKLRQNSVDIPRLDRPYIQCDSLVAEDCFKALRRHLIRPQEP